MGGLARVREIFLAFWRLGLTAFGGPIVHFVLFRQEFVHKRAWLTETQFGQLLTLAQFLPGPGSSKLGFAIGLLRGGWWGALAAFVAFTTPSVVILLAFASIAPQLSAPWGQAVLHGLKLLTVVMVSTGLYSMAKGLCPDWSRRALAMVAALVVFVLGQTALGQLCAIGMGAVGGITLCRQLRPQDAADLTLPYGRQLALRLMLGVLALLVILPLSIYLGGGQAAQYGWAFFKTGALAFGGGHVILPLLKSAVVDPGWIPNADFLSAYGAAQAVPGPMFALSAYLGAHLPGSFGGATGAAIALICTFLPGFMLMGGVLPFWHEWVIHPQAARAVAGVSAAVVGLLAAALYDPVCVSAIHRASDILISAVGVFALLRYRWSVLWILALCEAGVFLAML